MIIDIFFVLFLVLALVKGYQRGLIVGLFSLLALVIGLAAALKLSTVVAGYLGRSVDVSQKWLPFLSFLVVFVGVVLLVRLGARAIQGMVEAIALGWLNRIGGMLFYVTLYLTIFSVLLFYVHQLQWLKPEAFRDSVVYPFVKPWGPAIIQMIGTVIPIFKDMFEELERFFGAVAGNHPVA